MTQRTLTFFGLTLRGTLPAIFLGLIVILGTLSMIGGYALEATLDIWSEYLGNENGIPYWGCCLICLIPYFALLSGFAAVVTGILFGGGIIA